MQLRQKLYLNKAAAGRGPGILAEKQVWTSKAHAAGTTDEIPMSWKFTEKRLQEIAEKNGGVVSAREGLQRPEAGTSHIRVYLLPSGMCASRRAKSVLLPRSFQEFLRVSG
jgi:hypothetical protein